jgi:hypothetical protein
MKQFNNLFGTLAGAALTLACVETNAGITSFGHNEMDSDGVAIIMMADNSSTTRDDDAEPNMGGGRRRGHRW